MTDQSSGPEAREAIGSGRLEAFSDGVFSIAITLLVLDLAVPSRTGAEGRLAGQLGHEWPSYFAYLVSFTVIGIIWVNHHTVFSKVREVDRPVLFANLALLLTVSVLPFPTRLLAEYLTDSGSDAHVAAAIYSAAMLAMSLAFSTLWIIVTRDARLLQLRRFGIGLIFYLGTVGLSFYSAIVTLAVHAALALYYCFDQLTPAQPAQPAGPEEAPG
jgi:TMEM175 potassium channel family protein